MHSRKPPPREGRREPSPLAWGIADPLSCQKELEGRSPKVSGDRVQTVTGSGPAVDEATALSDSASRLARKTRPLRKLDPREDRGDHGLAGSSARYVGSSLPLVVRRGVSDWGPHFLFLSRSPPPFV